MARGGSKGASSADELSTRTAGPRENKRPRSVLSVFIDVAASIPRGGRVDGVGAEKTGKARGIQNGRDFAVQTCRFERVVGRNVVRRCGDVRLRHRPRQATGAAAHFCAAAREQEGRTGLKSHDLRGRRQCRVDSRDIRSSRPRVAPP